MTTDTLRLGDVGADVITLQARLRRAGFSVSADGHFGAQTEAAVREFQRERGLVVDGLAGARTCAALLGLTDPRHLTEADIEAAAASLGCDAAAVHAVIEVEAPRSGFLPDGRVVILFERHIMYRLLQAAGVDPAPYVKASPDIVNPHPGGYLGGAAEYGRLARAKAINADCALESASWGRLQIMGEHWHSLGYASVQAFVADMQTGEAAQLRAGVRFIAADPDMHQALVAHDWAAFAERYNGPAYHDHGYDLHLAVAYRRHAATDIPREPTAVAAQAAMASDAATTGTDAGPRRRGKRKATATTSESEATA